MNPKSIISQLPYSLRKKALTFITPESKNSLEFGYFKDDPERKAFVYAFRQNNFDNWDQIFDFFYRCDFALHRSGYDWVHIQYNDNMNFHSSGVGGKSVLSQQFPPKPHKVKWSIRKYLRTDMESGEEHHKLAPYFDRVYPNNFIFKEEWLQNQEAGSFVSNRLNIDSVILDFSPYSSGNTTPTSLRQSWINLAQSLGGSLNIYLASTSMHIHNNPIDYIHRIEYACPLLLEFTKLLVLKTKGISVISFHRNELDGYIQLMRTSIFDNSNLRSFSWNMGALPVACIVDFIARNKDISTAVILVPNQLYVLTNDDQQEPLPDLTGRTITLTYCGLANYYEKFPELGKIFERHIFLVAKKLEQAGAVVIREEGYCMLMRNDNIEVVDFVTRKWNLLQSA